MKFIRVTEGNKGTGKAIALRLAGMQPLTDFLSGRIFIFTDNNPVNRACIKLTTGQ